MADTGFAGFVAGIVTGTTAGILLRSPGNKMRSYGFLIAGAVGGQMVDWGRQHYVICAQQRHDLTAFEEFLAAQARLL
jgi:hypothetical protein